MKITSVTTLILAAAAAARSAAAEIYRPVKISYTDIMSGKGKDLSRMVDTLSEVGLISITNMPEEFQRNKKDTLTWTHPCAAKSATTKEHVFEDGTLRQTMASHTIPGPRGIQTMDHGGAAASACDQFQRASYGFRQEIDHLTRAFATRLSEEFPAGGGEPLLYTKGGFPFGTIADAVHNGEHLEHFHAYHGSAEAAVSSTNTKKMDSTIEWHTDQGFFLAFTPGVFTSAAKEQDESTRLDETEGFYIELQDGTKVLVQFDQSDDLVIMLGDGVNQYINPKLHGSRMLRAVPHALAMPNHEEGQSRVWYGRMVLPPADAVHPQHKETFGHLRELLIDASLGRAQEEHLELGCSSSTMFTHARQLEETSCEEGTTLCWHRCMSHAEQGISVDLCAEQGLDLRCINPRLQLWDDTHGDWYPACINASTAPMGTDYPPLAGLPRDNETCSEVAHATFVDSNAANYEFMHDLGYGATLYWTVEGENINGMLSYDGLFGYLAIGFAGPEGFSNTMMGAIIIMANPSDTYTAQYGFDLEEGEPSVDEFLINTTALSFRRWSTPVTAGTEDVTTATARSGPKSNPESYEILETECYTALTFNTPGIYNTTFNVTGTDKLIWAANGEDYSAGYHTARGNIWVEWATGKVILDHCPPHTDCGGEGEDEEHDHDHDHDHDHSDHKDEGEELESSAAAPMISGLSLMFSSLFVMML